MNLTPWSKIAGSSSSFLVASVCLLASVGCGGSVYSLGSLLGEGGPDAESDGKEVGHICTRDSPCDGGDSFSTGTGAEGGTSGFKGGGDGGTDHIVDVDAGDTTGQGDGGCAVTPTACSGGATAYACGPGDYPESSTPTLSCSSGTIHGYHVDYCCFPWPGVDGPCAPFPGFPCDDGAYAYQCSSGTLPPDIDSKLSCGTSFPDSDGENDFCCTLK